MKYVLKNLKSFFQDSMLVAILAVVSVFVSALVINFSYGIYQNYNVVLEKGAAQDEISREDSMHFSMCFYKKGNNPGEYVSQEMFMKYIDEVMAYSDELYEEIAVFTAYAEIDNHKFEFKFNTSGGDISIAKEFVENCRKYGNMSGGYWTDTDERLGNPVALGMDKSKFDNTTPYYDSLLTENNTLLIAGKEYEIVGYHNWGNDTVLMPIRSIGKDECMLDLDIYFKEGLSKETFARLSETTNAHFGDLVTIDKTPTIDRDSIYTYKTVMIIAVLIALISALNFMILYRYILNRRKKKTAVYRLCGLTTGRASRYNMVECLIITIPVYLLGMLTYDKVFLPVLGNYFSYMQKAYTVKLYVILFLIYLVISFLVCGIFIVADNRKKILEQMKA